MLAVAVRGGSNLLQSPMSAATNMICHDDDDDYLMMILIMILMVIIKVKIMMVTMKVFCNAKQTKVEEKINAVNTFCPPFCAKCNLRGDSAHTGENTFCWNISDVYI